MPIVEREDRHAGAFDHIICPCCGSDEWCELVHNGVYCVECNTQCRLKETTGDQGFIAVFDSEGFTWPDDGVEPIPESEQRGQVATEKWLGIGGHYERYWFSTIAEHERDIEWQPAWD